jgi:hypothetical protein
MARPKVEDETIEKAAEIINESVTVPLPADELSTNQQLRIIVDAVYAGLHDRDTGSELIIDRYDTTDDDPAKNFPGGEHYNS